MLSVACRVLLQPHCQSCHCESAGIIILALIIGDRESVITDSRMSLLDFNAKHLLFSLFSSALLSPCIKAYQRGCTVFHCEDFLLDLLSLALISAWLQSYLGF